MLNQNTSKDTSNMRLHYKANRIAMLEKITSKLGKETQIIHHNSRKNTLSMNLAIKKIRLFRKKFKGIKTLYLAMILMDSTLTTRMTFKKKMVSMNN